MLILFCYKLDLFCNDFNDFMQNFNGCNQIGIFCTQKQRSRTFSKIIGELGEGEDEEKLMNSRGFCFKKCGSSEKRVFGPGCSVYPHKEKKTTFSRVQ